MSDEQNSGEKPSIISPDEILPVVGKDLTPTPEMIADGRHGNGSWETSSPEYEAAAAIVHQEKREAADKRREAFNERARNALDDAVDLHHRIIKSAQKVMDKIEAGEKVTQAEYGLVAKAQKSAIELTDRAAGKSRPQQEETQTTTFLAQLVEKGKS